MLVVLTGGVIELRRVRLELRGLRLSVFGTAEGIGRALADLVEGLTALSAPLAALRAAIGGDSAPEEPLEALGVVGEPGRAASGDGAARGSARCGAAVGASPRTRRSHDPPGVHRAGPVGSRCKGSGGEAGPSGAATVRRLDDAIAKHIRRLRAPTQSCWQLITPEDGRHMRATCSNASRMALVIG